MNMEWSTATRINVRQTVDHCGQPTVNNFGPDLRKHHSIHNPQPLLLRPTFYLPEKKVSAR